MARRILVAVDNPIQAEHVRLLLEGAGYAVHMAANGREGLRSIQSTPPDLIISDVGLPEMDGYAFCGAVKSAEATKRIPFVLLTKRKTPIDIVHGLEIGADNFITKPFDDEYLLERVRRIFEHLEFRHKGYLEVEVTVHVAGRDISITADKQQIIELLFASFEELERVNARLLESQRTVEKHAVELEAEVERRTQQLRESEARFRSAFGDAAIGMALVGTDCRILQVNRSLTEIVGYSEQELLATTFQAITHPNDLEPTLAYMRQTLAGDRHSFQMEKRYVHKQGGQVWVLLSTSLVRDDHGAPLYFVSQVQDITSRKRAEEALRESEKRFRNMADTAPVMVWMSGLDGLCTFFNKPWLEFTGRTMEQEQGNGWAEGVHPEDVQRCLHTYTSAFHARQNFTMEYRLRRADGEHRWVLDTGVPRYEPDDNFVGYIGSCIDITERRRREEALRESEERLRLALDAAQMGQWDWNIITGEVVWSRKCLALYGLPPDTPMSYDRFLQTLHPEDRERIDTALRRVVEDRRSYDELKRTVWPDGSVHWTDSRGQVYCDAEGQPVRMIGITFDVTERKRAEEALRESEGRLAEAQRITHVGYWDRDIDADRITWSDETYRIFGLPLQERTFHLAQLQELIHPEDRQIMFQAVAEALGGGPRYDVEYRVVRPSGEVRFVHSQGDVTWDESGRPRRMFGTVQDITESKRSEATLRASQERYRSLVENAPLCIHEIDSAGRLISMNPAGLKMMGATDEGQVCGMAYLDVVSRADRSRVDGLLARAFAGESSELEFVAANEDEARIFASCFVPLREKEGPVQKIMGITQDITERKRAEQSLEHSRLLLQSFVEHTPAAVAMLDKELRYVAVSKRWLYDYRLGGQNIIGRHHYDVFPEIRKLKEWQEVHQRCLAGAVERRDEDRFVREDGSEDWLRWAVRPWYDISGEVAGIIMFTEVITERKRAEATLRESDARFRSAFGDAAIGMALVATDGRFLQVNRSLTEIVGYSEQELMATTFQAITHPDDLAPDLAYVRQTLAGERLSYQMEKRYIHKLGHVVWALLTVSLLRDAHGSPMYFVSQIQDITERKRAEATHQALSQRLVEVQESERRSIARELHDEIGQVLTGLKLTLEMSGRLPLEEMGSTLDEARVLVDDLMAKVRELSLDLRPAMLDDLGLLPTLLWHIERYRARTSARVSFRQSGLEGRRFSSKLETTIYRIVQEALTNVARHAGVCEVVVQVWVRQDAIVVQIGDHGVGFDPETVLSAGETSGLAGMRERAALLGGRLTVESTSGAGTRIVADLPLRDPIERRLKEGYE